MDLLSYFQNDYVADIQASLQRITQDLENTPSRTEQACIQKKAERLLLVSEEMILVLKVCIYSFFCGVERCIHDMVHAGMYVRLHWLHLEEDILTY